MHDCSNRIKNLISKWIQIHCTSQLEGVVVDLGKQYLSSEHSIRILQKAVSDLSSRIDKLQAQEMELTTQIKTTSKAY